MLKHALKINTDGHLDVLLTFGPSIHIKDPQKDCDAWEKWNKDLLHKSLKLQGL
jgi:hypothetical protein